MNFFERYQSKKAENVPTPAQVPPLPAPPKPKPAPATLKIQLDSSQYQELTRALQPVSEEVQGGGNVPEPNVPAVAKAPEGTSGLQVNWDQSKPLTEPPMVKAIEGASGLNIRWDQSAPLSDQPVVAQVIQEPSGLRVVWDRPRSTPII